MRGIITRDEIELLINGGHVKKMLHQELTCRDLDSDIDNLWSILFTTGYLTQGEEDVDGISLLSISNREIHWIYVQQIRKWFQDETRKDFQKLETFCKAFEEKNLHPICEKPSTGMRLRATKNAVGWFWDDAKRKLPRSTHGSFPSM